MSRVRIPVVAVLVAAAAAVLPAVAHAAPVTPVSQEAAVVRDDPAAARTSTLEKLQFHLTLDNRTTKTLNIASVDLVGGKFAESPRPIAAKSKEKAFFAQGRENSPTGTWGTVRYRFGDNASRWFEIYWEVPYNPFESSKVTVTTSDQDVLVPCKGLDPKAGKVYVTCQVALLG